MTSTTDHTPRPPKTKRRRADPELLRSQKQTGSMKPKVNPAPTQKPTQDETVTLASGEKRTVKIEATNDKEWNDLATLAEGATALSLDQKDITHRTIAAIAALRIAHEEDWKPYCQSRGLKWPKEAKSAFRAVVMWVLNLAKAKTGENHTSKASMISGCLDEYWEMQRPCGMVPGEIAEWLDESGGYTTVCRDRLDRLRDPKDKAEERYHRYLMLKPLEQRDIPDWMSGFAGEVLISAHIDQSSGKLEYRSVCQPEGSAFWYSRLDQFIAARPDYGKAVEPVRTSTPQLSVDNVAGDGETEPLAEIQGREPSDSDEQSLDPGTRATLDKIHADFAAIKADLASREHAA